MNRGMIVVLTLSVLSFCGCSSSVSVPAASNQARAQLKQSAEVLSIEDASAHAKARHGRSAMARERILK